LLLLLLPLHLLLLLLLLLFADGGGDVAGGSVGEAAGGCCLLPAMADGRAAGEVEGTDVLYRFAELCRQGEVGWCGMVLLHGDEATHTCHISHRHTAPAAEHKHTDTHTH
jgi:hypothetical protein